MVKIFFAILIFFSSHSFGQVITTLKNSQKEDQLKTTKLNTEKLLPVKEVENQGRTGTCWSFSGSSFYESELLKKEIDVDLSEMYWVRNIYLDKAQNYLLRQGQSQFSQGSIAHDVLNAWQKYGAIPETEYSGLNGKTEHNHNQMFQEMKLFLDSMLQDKKLIASWKDSINLIMDRYMGPVPKQFTFQGKQYSPIEFSKFLNLNPDNYLGFTSFSHHSFYKGFVLEIPDNFSNGIYYNLPIEEFIAVIDNALNKGFTIHWDGDVSELGFDAKNGVAFISENIPQDYYQQHRQENFENWSTTDDHLMHIVGKQTANNGEEFYLVKNSWGINSGKNGYILMTKEYLALKTISFYVNKNALEKEILKKCGLKYL